jgi:DNA-binding LytR/AlgR family response regulator
MRRVIRALSIFRRKGYELDVTDYLLKPVTFDRFVKAVNKVHDLFMQEMKNQSDEFVFVKSDKQYKKIILKNILFIESMENYIIIHTGESKEIVYTTLKQILQSLPDKTFLQVHRSYIANVNQIKAIEGNQLIIGKHKIPIARNLREAIFNTILNNHLMP